MTVYRSDNRVAQGSVSSCTFGDVGENLDQDPLSGSDEVSGDVVEDGFFHANCCGWPWLNGFSPVWLLPHV